MRRALIFTLVSCALVGCKDDVEPAADDAALDGAEDAPSEVDVLPSDASEEADAATSDTASEETAPIADATDATASEASDATAEASTDAEVDAALDTTIVLDAMSDGATSDGTASDVPIDAPLPAPSPFSVRGGIGGNVNDFARTAAGDMFAATSSGLVFKRAAGAALYRPSSSGAWGENVASVDASGSTVFAASNALFKSTDGGATWTEVYTPVGFMATVGIVGSDVIAGSFEAGAYRILRSVSGGAFTATTPPPGGTPRGIATSGTNIYVATSAGVYTSKSSGASWTLVTNGLTDSNSKAVMDVVARGSNVYLATRGGLYRSTDSGDSYTYVTGSYLVLNPWVAIADTGTKIHAVTQYGRFATSSDGVSFDTSKSLPNDDFCEWKTMLADATNVWAASTCGVLRTSDGGATWVPDMDGINGNIIAELRVRTDGGATFAKGDLYALAGDRIHVSRDGGATWKKTLTKVNVFGLAVTKLGTLFAPEAATGVGRRSVDGGATWSSVTFGTGTGLGVYATFATLDGAILVGTAGGGVFRSGNDGVSFTKASGTASNDNKIFAQNPVTKAIYLGTTFDGLYKSTDDGATWSKISPTVNGTADIQMLTVAPDGTLYAASKTWGISRGIDTGSSIAWTKLTFSTLWYDALFVDGAGRLYVHTINTDGKNQSRLFRSDDKGASFVEETDLKYLGARRAAVGKGGALFVATKAGVFERP